MAKQRVHNEYFRTVSCGNRKSCPQCGEKLSGEFIWSWGQYISAKWNTVQYFCRVCYPTVQRKLQSHSDPCGCTFQLQGYGGQQLPSWLRLEG
jgi:hypothetical protein